MPTDPHTPLLTIARVAAREAHREMRASGASHYELGSFYKDMLTRRLWSSQSDLAKSLGVSESTVSRVIDLTRIPTEVVEAIGGARHISFRIGGLLLSAIDRIGAAVFVSRVREAVRMGYAAVDDILEFAVFDRIPKVTPTTARVRLARDKRSLRVEIPDLDELLPHLATLEACFLTALDMMSRRLTHERVMAGHIARSRLRAATSSPDGRTEKTKPPRKDLGRR